MDSRVEERLVIVAKLRCSVLTDDLNICFCFQWLREALDYWKSWYYNARTVSPMLQSGRILYHLGHVALSANAKTLFIAAGSKFPTFCGEGKVRC